MSAGMQEQSLASRLADVMVSVRADLTYTRQVNRDGISYIVHHPVTFQNHRLSAEDYLIVSHLRDSRTLSETLDRLVQRGLLEQDQEEDFYRFVVHLNQLHLLRLPVSDANQLHDRFVEKAKKQRVQTAKSFLFFRIPLFEPMPFLDRTLSFVRPLFSRGAAIVWCCALLFCIGLIVRRWDEFGDPLGSVLATSNLAILWLLLLGLKVVHEFGHAYACRNFGAKVPEMGAFFLMGSPCAYMDASDSWNLTKRRQRLIVAMGGIYFESWCAMLAVLVWTMTEPSLVNSIAQYVVVLSTVITIGFNINPLMKYDGYYALTDLLGRPLLREDAAFEFTRLVKRVLFGLRIESRTSNTAERVWLVVFGIACSIYRLAIAISIATVLGMFVPLLGSVVLIAYVGSTVVKLAKAGVVYLRTSEEIQDRRRRAYAASSFAFAGCIVAMMLIPVPGGMRISGVVIPQKQLVAYATVPGFLREANVENGAAVANGAVLCVLENTDLDRQVSATRTAVRDLEIQLASQLRTDVRAMATTQQQLRQMRESLAEAELQRDRLVIVAPDSGVISKAEAIQKQGRYVRAGEPLASIGVGQSCVVALLDEEMFSDAMPKTGDMVQLRIPGANSVLTGRISHLRRTASDQISVPQLTQSGGGDIPVAMEDQRAQRPYVQVRIDLDVPNDELLHGQRAVVRLASAGSSIATIALRSVRRLFDQL
jgi:putative peptide zinc metalloprotease protein